MPKVIASGESVTIPAGRVAILPDVQVDGTLNVLGDIFIPTGTANSKVVQKVTSTDKAIPRFNGTTGDVQDSGVIIDNNNNITTQGSSSGTNGGAFVLVKNGATSNIGIGNYSALNGGAYDSTPTLWCQGGLNITDNTTSRVRIDSVGNVGIGVTPSGWGSGGWLEIASTAGLTAKGGLNIGSNWYFNNDYKYTTTAAASNYFQQNGKHTWYTASSGTAGNAINWTNVMSLDANGNWVIGSSIAGATNADSITAIPSQGWLGINHINGKPTDSGYQYFIYNGTTIGSITQNGTTAVAYNTTSDYRLKENVRPADCKKFMDIKFVDYERIDGRHECGVIAHELQEIYPDLVTGEKDATEIRKVEISPAVEEVKDEEGNIIVEAVEAVYEEQEFPVYQQVNYMGLIARIGTVVQQQAKLIEAMIAEIDELKGAK